MIMQGSRYVEKYARYPFSNAESMVSQKRKEKKEGNINLMPNQ